MDEFEDRFRAYVEEAGRANTEAAKCFLFLEFVRRVFGVKESADAASKLFPALEKHVGTQTLAYKRSGRIDAYLGSLIIEFKLDLRNQAESAEQQLKRYADALAQVGENPLLMASDGIRLRAYRSTLSGLQPVDEVDLSSRLPREAYLWLDRYMMVRTALPPEASAFAAEFGLGGPVFKIVSSELGSLWQSVRSEPEISLALDQWRIHLSNVYGEQVASEEMFLRHTYLALLAKLMVYMRLSPGVPSGEEILRVVRGEAFRGMGIHNFLEEDLFSWLGRDPCAKVGEGIGRKLLGHLSRYDMSKVNEDVLKQLYQELVDPEVRHGLGEYYTPDWLAEWIVQNLLKDDPGRSVIDPACGSGTFLFAAIRYKREKLKPEGLLEEVTTRVVGIDIHPLAVIVSRATYLLALGDLLRFRRRDIRIPVYMANSIRLPEARGVVDILGPSGKPVSTYIVQANGTELYIPTSVARIPEASDAAIDYVTEAAKGISSGDDVPLETFRNTLTRRMEVAAEEGAVQVLHRTAANLAKLIKERRDTLWSFYLKNFHKPVFLSQTKSDVVVGNPPWISYRYILNTDYQAYLKDEMKAHGLFPKGHLVTHMEMATLFMVKAADLYLRQYGQIGFVMPRSIFSADQHDAFRQGKFFEITTLADLTGVSPLFNVPASVVFGRKTGTTSFPLKGYCVAGSLPEKNLTFKYAQNHLSFQNEGYNIYRIGERSFWGTLDEAAKVSEGRSYYYDSFRQGATIVPRVFYFVEPRTDPVLGLHLASPYVESSTDAVRLAKKPYRGLSFAGRVDGRFLYATLLGSDVVPFAHLPFRVVMLPLVVEGDRYRMVIAQELERGGYTDTGQWVKRAEKEWANQRGEKAGKMTVYERLNYSQGILAQNPEANVRVVYTTSGTNVAATVVTGPYVHNVDGHDLPLSGFLADHKTYVCELRNSREAHYLSAVLNSSFVNKAIKPVQSRGLFGERDIHKKLLELPIPRYESKGLTHRRLSELGSACSAKVGDLLPSLKKRYRSVAKIRDMLRQQLSSELAEIDELVEQILSS